jgi:hypothetical protein
MTTINTIPVLSGQRRKDHNNNIWHVLAPVAHGTRWNVALLINGRSIFLVRDDAELQTWPLA